MAFTDDLNKKRKKVKTIHQTWLLEAKHGNWSIPDEVYEAVNPLREKGLKLYNTIGKNPRRQYGSHGRWISSNVGADNRNAIFFLYINEGEESPFNLEEFELPCNYSFRLLEEEVI